MGLLYWEAAAENGRSRFSRHLSQRLLRRTQRVLNKLAGGAKVGTVSAEGQSCHLNGSRLVGE